MNDCVQDCLTKGIEGNGICLDPVNPFVGDGGFHVLGTEHLHRRCGL